MHSINEAAELKTRHALINCFQELFPSRVVVVVVTGNVERPCSPQRRRASFFDVKTDFVRRARHVFHGFAVRTNTCTEGKQMIILKGPMDTYKRVMPPTLFVYCFGWQNFGCHLLSQVMKI